MSTYLLNPPATPSSRITPPLLTLPYPHGYLSYIDMIDRFIYNIYIIYIYIFIYVLNKLETWKLKLKP